MKRAVYIVLCFCLVAGSVSASSEGVKRHEFAGTFYPADAAALKEMISRYLADAHPPLFPRIAGIIVPHAGYIYSGAVAAHSYKAAAQAGINRIILMGPSHHYAFKGIALYPDGAFSTPLGTVIVDSVIAARLASLDFVRPKREYFYGEHSIEVQLPFIQTVFPMAKIVPLLFGTVNFSQLQELGRFLSELAQTENVLVVVSTDLSHYHPYRQARQIDAETVLHIGRRDADWLFESVVSGQRRACGMLPLVAFISYVKKMGGTIDVLQYATSGDTAGDKKRVVGYVSALAYRPQTTDKEEEAMGLSQEEKKTLLSLARSTLESTLADKPLAAFTSKDPVFQEKRAVFVTLKEHGQLRGCIGRIVADFPLYQAVSRQVVEAALHDPRFPSVTVRELDDITIEISVMTPFEKVQSLDEIQVGTHGLMIRRGFNQGILLPQVPGEFGWDKKTYLEHLCYKAGLPAQAYKEKGTEIQRFSAEVFSEEEFSERE